VGLCPPWLWVLQQRAGTPNLICSPQTVPKLSCLCGTESSAEQNDFPATLYRFTH